MNEMTSANDPLVTHGIVEREWTDYNGHMNVAYYVLLFDRATDAMLDHVDLGERYRGETSCSVFVAEAHVTYEQELDAGAPVTVLSWVTATDDRKRFVIYHEMKTKHDVLAATNEVLCVHVDLKTRRSAILPEAGRERLSAAIFRPTNGPENKRMGRSIDLNARRPAPSMSDSDASQA
jgi:acyl-CoA thioester hydrolase